MKNIIHALLAILMLISFVSCQNTYKENKVKKPKLTIEHRKIENFKGYNQNISCFELITREKIFFAEIENNQLLDTTRSENYFQNYPISYPTKIELSGEDENYKIEVIPYYYQTSLLVFEDKQTGIFYFTIMSNPQGIYFLEGAYWIIGVDCHMGCYSSIKRIENPKTLTSNSNLDSLVSQANQAYDSNEEMMKIYEKAEEVFSCDDLSHNLLGFIPYKKSIILFLNTTKRVKKLDDYRKEYNLSSANGKTGYFTIQVHQDKTIDTLENTFKGTMFGMPYDGCTILPKNQNSISFCQVVFKIENDTLFIYSLE